MCTHSLHEDLGARACTHTHTQTHTCTSTYTHPAASGFAISATAVHAAPTERRLAAHGWLFERAAEGASLAMQQAHSELHQHQPCYPVRYVVPQCF